MCITPSMCHIPLYLYEVYSCHDILNNTSISKLFIVSHNLRTVDVIIDVNLKTIQIQQGDTISSIITCVCVGKKKNCVVVLPKIIYL